MTKDMNKLILFIEFFSRLLTLLLVIPVHESAHAWVAHKLGDDTAYSKGRVSLNPFVHFDLIGCGLMLLTGFGWAKPVPVDPRNMKKSRAGFALTALAGPVSNLLAALIADLAYSLLICTDKGALVYVKGETGMIFYVYILLEYICRINVGLAVFNMIPLPPLDGFNVLRYFTSEKVDRWFYAHQRELSMGFLIVIIFMNRIPSQYNPIYMLTDFIYDVLWKCVVWIPQLRWN